MNLLFLKKKKQKDFYFWRWIGVVVLAGCSSPEPNLYTLTATEGTAQTSSLRSIEVRRPGLAGYLDRSDIVLKNDDYRLSTNSQQRWGEPLGDMIGRVLTQDLTQRLPGTSLYAQSGAITAYPDARLEVDILNFDPAGGGAVTLNAAYALESGTGHHPLSEQHVSLQAPAASGPANLAASMSGLLGQLADRIAQDAARASPSARIVQP